MNQNQTRQTSSSSSSLEQRRRWFPLLRALARDDGGQSIVELAITAPLLILLLAGAIDVGRYMYQGIEVGNAARAGVQYGAQSLVTAADTSPTGGMVNAAKADAKEIPGLTATASNSCSCYSSPSTTFACTVPIATMPCNTTGTDHRVVLVQVVASGTFNSFLRYPGIPSTLTITRTAIQQATP